jgi:hypothetical protein
LLSIFESFLPSDTYMSPSICIRALECRQDSLKI